MNTFIHYLKLQNLNLVAKRDFALFRHELCEWLHVVSVKDVPDGPVPSGLKLWVLGVLLIVVVLHYYWLEVNNNEHRPVVSVEVMPDGLCLAVLSRLLF